MMTLFTIIAVCTVIDFVLSGVFVAAYFYRADTLLVGLGLVLSAFSLVHIVVLCIFWHRAWRSIQDEHCRTTPGKAVGFLFIPVFNLYWAFVMLWGFAKDYNAFCRRHEIDGAPRLPEGFFLTVAILGVVFMFMQFVPIIGVIYGMAVSLAALVLLYKTTRAVIAIHQPQSQA